MATQHQAPVPSDLSQVAIRAVAKRRRLVQSWFIAFFVVGGIRGVSNLTLGSESLPSQVGAFGIIALGFLAIPMVIFGFAFRCPRCGKVEGLSPVVTKMRCFSCELPFV